MSMSELLTRFADVRRDDPKRPLIHLPGVGATLRADDIWDAHLRYADRLTRRGVAPGQLVVAALGNSAEVVALLAACRALDVALMPLDAGTTPAEVGGVAERFAAAAVVDPDATTATEWTPRQYASAALLKLTSGSTGAPKAALTTEAQLIADASHIVRAMDIRPADTQIAAIPVSHSYGLGNLLVPLLMQGTPFVLRDSFVPHQLPADARRFSARVFPGVPFMFEYFLANTPADGWPSCLQQLISAGAPLSNATARAFHERFGVKIHSFYGATETGGIAYDDSDDPDTGGTIGRPLTGVTITLRRDGARETERQPDAGRIHVRSDAVASGYSDGEHESFTDGGFLTGDYGAWDEGDRLMLLGRVSSFVNVAGRKVQPDEVEQVLRGMPGVADVRVIAAHDERRGQQIVACVVADGSGVTALGVRSFCAARLAPHKIPRRIVFVDAIPLTARGKTDRVALDDLVRARTVV
jgi:long-chain acyl-CoA synthetase